MKRMDVATNLAEQLFEAEAAIEAAYCKIGALAQALPEARARSGMSSTVGQAAFQGLMESMAGQVQSRSAMILVHQELARLKANSPYRAVAIGGGLKEDEPVERPQGRLALVS
ncbi:hypothetical protein [Brevundimonas lenta]|uniref:Flagellar protein FlgN n=1 Tax=Brevundimonas lenta TaxID=424796 RepID=A0A7W6NPF2_9CAUL|nr:hypothetical protein [Brevundimonas lenta]MBB4082474.1 hypothetical protein [Brevundimonas lenta]